MPEIADIPVPASALSSADPFPGLRPYGEEDANWFFGRSAEVNDLLKRLRRLHFVAVVGASGSGKSSLVRAGLLPQIRDGYLDAEWRIATFRPGEQPIANLAASLGLDIDSRLDSQLRSGPAGLVRALQRSGLAGRDNILIVVDQFEELFQFAQRRGDEAQEEIKEFLKLLLTAVTSDDVAVYVIVTMRLEWLNECATYTGLAEAINEGIYLVPQMQRRQFGQAILGPLESADGSLTSALLDRMLNDLDNRSDQLPVLQHALLRLWARGHTEEPFDIADYEAVGTFSHCLSNHAQEVYNELTDRQKGIAELLFRNITQMNKNRKIRRPRPLGEIQQVAHVDLTELVPVVLAFSRPGRSFLVTTQGALTPESIVDISHEALIRQWALLNEWVDSEAEIQARLLRLYEDAAEWDRDRPHSRSCLYTGARLARAEELTSRLDSSGPASDFLRASERARFWMMMRRRGFIALTAVSVIVIALGLVLISRERAKDAERAQREAENTADLASLRAKQAQEYENHLKQQLNAANGSSTAIAAIVHDLNAKKIYIQYTPGQADTAHSIQGNLQKSNFVVPGTQQVSPDKAPSATQVRYFNAEDKAEAANIVSMLRQWVPGAASAQSAPNPRNAVPPGQFEVWLARPAAAYPSELGMAPPAPETKTAPVATPATPAPTLTASLSDPRVQKGRGVKLSWHSENATTVELEGMGTVQPSGSMVMTPEQTTTYRLTAKGSGAPAVQSVTVEVVEPPPVNTPSTASVPPIDAARKDDTQISQILLRYVDAYQSESLDLLKKVWPTISDKQQRQLKGMFNQFNAVRLDLNWSSPVITGDTATSQVQQTATFTQRGQVQPAQVTRSVFTFRKTNGQWQLDSIQ